MVDVKSNYEILQSGMRILIPFALASYLHATPTPPTGNHTQPPFINPAPSAGQEIERLPDYPTQNIESKISRKVSIDEGQPT